jgi:hypothetical protein
VLFLVALGMGHMLSAHLLPAALLLSADLLRARLRVPAVMLRNVLVVLRSGMRQLW